MSLTAQYYGEIVSHLRRGGADAGREKRRASRVNVSGKIDVAVLAKGAAAKRFSVCMRDLSINGMGLLSSVAIEKGQPFVAILPRGKAEPVNVMCEATYCGLLADGIYSIGCRFTRVMSAELFARLEAAAVDVARIRESVLNPVTA
ncbi:MAG TPA: PilZ domain-containing protein [Tepidisphaeraceae bacterium]|jgi:hypothetical protein|nr:PilZ domain-containing protein [Tepidisphaeraceae bacterium]